MTVFDYLQEKYKKTKWCFIPVKQVVDKFGDEGTKQLNELAKKGFIAKREGFNFDLIEIIPEKFE